MLLYLVFKRLKRVESWGVSVTHVVFARCVEFEEDEQKYRESPQRRAAVTEERQRNADYGTQSYDHAYVDAEVEYEIGSHAVGVDASESGGLAFADCNHTQYECKEEECDEHGAYEAFFLADCAEDEVGVLLGDIFELGLRAVEEAFACKTARADGDCRLVDIIPGSAQILHNAECHLYAQTLVGLQFLERHVHREHEAHGKDSRGDSDVEFRTAVFYGLNHNVYAGNEEHREDTRHGRECDAAEVDDVHHQPASGEPEHEITPDFDTTRIDNGHTHHYEHEHDEYGEFAGWYAEYHGLGIFDGNHEDYHGEESCEEHQSAHALAVEDKEKRHERQG